ncbi:WD40 repeat-like protein [Trametes sanguinea]|nr:WD40 repeat-like protein [Trametes sanguinea]
MEEDIRENRQHSDQRFDGIHTHVDEGINRVLDATTSAIPGLQPTLSALYNDSESGRSECEPGTRTEALATIYAWILGPGHPDLSQYPEPVLDVRHERLIMWLYALAGAGKSTISMTTAQWCSVRRILAATFFCARDGDRSNVLAIMPTIAYQLARLCAIFRAALRKAIAENPNVHQMSVASQLEKLIIDPLCAAIEGGSHAFDNAVIIIDALDECTDNEAVSVVVKSLALHHDRLGPLRILVTSRPDPHIKAGFVIPALAANTQEFPLSQIPDEFTARDISLFLRRRLKEIAEVNYLGSGWPSENAFQGLVRLAELLFIFAATAVRFIGDVEAMDPAGRLRELLQAGAEAAAMCNSRKSPFWILDVLYLQVLASVRKVLGEAALGHLRGIVGALVLAQERLGPAALEALLELNPGTVRRFLSRLSAILILPAPGDDFSPIRLIHLSFTNFIIDPSRCIESAFLITPAVHHTVLAKNCLRILLTLRHNICEVEPEYQHLLNREIPDLQEKIARHLPPERQYAVKYWSHHLLHAEVDQQLLNALQAFCNKHLLDWIEALSLLGCVHVAIEVLPSAQQLLKKLHPPPKDVLALLYDCERIVRTFYEGMSASFFEVLRATTTFAPGNSPLRRRHAANLPGIVQLRRGRDTGWSATLTPIDTGCWGILRIDFSPDGNLLACSTFDNSIQLRNVQTGAKVHVMEGHEGWVRGLSFSPDGKTILAGDDTGSVKLWDVAMGACLGTWKRHSIWIRSVAWSPDGTLAASGSSREEYGSDSGETIRLWTIASPESPEAREATQLSSYRATICSVVFAADGTLLSGSVDHTCKVWDTHTETLIRTLDHNSAVLAMAVSPNNQLVACGLDDGQTVIWDKANGVKLHTLPGPMQVRSLKFYANATLAAAYGESSLMLWDMISRAPLKVLRDRGADARTAAFSPDGIHTAVAMGSAVNIIQWPIDTTRTSGQSVEDGLFPSHDGHATRDTLDDSHKREQIVGVSISPDGLRIASVLRDKVELLDVSTGNLMYTGILEHEAGIMPAPIGWSPSAKLIAWGGGQRDVCLWKTESRRRVRSLTGHSGLVRAVHFTLDEQHVLSASDDGTIRLWNVNEEHVSFKIVLQCSGPIWALVVSSDGKWMISCARDGSPPDTSSPDLLARPSRAPFKERFGWYPTVRLHDAAGRVLWIEHTTEEVLSLALSDDCTRAVAGLRKGRILLFNLTQLLLSDKATSNLTGRLLHSGATPTVPVYELSNESMEPAVQIAFSPDGRGLLIGNGYQPLDVAHRPLSSRDSSLSSPPFYFIAEGWLWSFSPAAGRQRLCWVPPAFRRDEDNPERSWSVREHIIACGTPGIGVVILDASPCIRTPRGTA